jgi:RNA polymerase sigma-70 factor (ECF subfamily)
MVTSRRDAGSEPDGTAGLIRRARNGDRDAFDWLASFHQDCLQRFVSRKVSDPEDVADLCQEILVHAYLKLNSFQGRSGFGTWLLSIAKRAIAEYYRSNHAATIIEQYRGTRGSIVRDNALRSYGEAMEESCDIRQQIEDRLACVITVLSLEEQLAVILCDFYGFTDNESSTIMAKSLGAFKHDGPEV